MDDKTTAGLIHLLGALGLGIVSIILWVINKDKSEFIDKHGKEFTNFMINVAVAGVALGIIGGILGGIFAALDIGILIFIVSGLIWILSMVLGIAVLVLCIKGAIAGFNEKEYEYPSFIYRIIK